MVLGVEGTYDFSDWRGDHQNITVAAIAAPIPQFGTLADRYSTRIDGIATLAGRVGFASDAIDRTQFYAKGGAAYGRETYSQASSGAIQFGAPPPQLISFTGLRTGGDDRWGWMAGLGVEHGLTDNWSVKIDYDYLDFGTKSALLSGSGCTSNGGAPFCTRLSTKHSVAVARHQLSL